MNRKEYLQAVIDSQKSPIEVFMEFQTTPDSVTIVDVRIGDKSILKEKIIKAIEIPLIELEKRVNELDKSKNIYVTTWSSSCTLAKQASIMLVEKGYQVKEIGGGNEAWKLMNLPMEEILVNNND